MDKNHYSSASYKDGLSFHYFKSIIEQFDPECPIIEVSTLYRFAWVAGNNVVNLDSFLLAAHERNFFIRNMKIDGVFSYKDDQMADNVDPEEIK